LPKSSASAWSIIAWSCTASPSIARPDRPALIDPVSILRRWRRIAALVASLALCLPPHLLWRLAGRPSPWPPIFLGLAARAVGTRVEVVGMRLRRDVFFVANHLSWIDILALAGKTGTAFIARDGVARWPLIGWLAKQNNTVFIARHSRQGVGGQVDQMRAALARHQPLTLFPEGTTNDGTALLPFRPALFAGLMPAPRALLVQPVYIDYGPVAPAIAWVGEETPGANVWRVLACKGPLIVTLHFLDPFDPADYADRKAVCAEARKRIDARVRPFVPAPPPV
jgi:1-acyl-sn-glycerol-3-phosphate acyltransferase